MKSIENIKEKFGNFILKKELSKLNRQTKIQNFTTAKVVGFIFDARSMETYKASVNFMDFVNAKGINVHGLGIIDNINQKDALPYKVNVNYLSLDTLNWFGKAQSESAGDLLRAKFDILVDISMLDMFAIKYIFAMSNSIFKITNLGSKAKYADFVIEIDNNESIENFTKHIIHYLDSIKIS